MLIWGDTTKQRDRARRVVKSARKHDKTPGKHYVLVVPGGGRGSERNAYVNVDGQRVMIPDHMGFTEDREFAAAAAATGRVQVYEREKKFATGRAFFSFSDTPGWDKINWHREETRDGSTTATGADVERADCAG